MTQTAGHLRSRSSSARVLAVRVLIAGSRCRTRSTVPVVGSGRRRGSSRRRPPPGCVRRRPTSWTSTPSATSARTTLGRPVGGQVEQQPRRRPVVRRRRRRTASRPRAPGRAAGRGRAATRRRAARRRSTPRAAGRRVITPTRSQISCDLGRAGGWTAAPSGRRGARSTISARMSAMPAGSRPLVGSSSTISSGSPISAAATPSRCFMPERVGLEPVAAAVGQVDPRQRLVDAGLGQPAVAGHHPQVVAAGQVRVEARPLDQGADASVGLGVARRLAEHACRPGRRAHEAQAHPQRRGLAGAVRAEEAVDLAAPDGHADASRRPGGRRTSWSARASRVPARS